MEYQLRKMPGPVLMPMHDCDVEKLQQVKNGALMLADIKQPRNPAFHNKYFAMLNFAYQYWEPPEVKLGGLKAEKQFERFRKDIQVLAGYRVAVVNIKGEARYESESISFSSMEEGRFSEVYKNVFSVLWRLVLSKVPNLSEAEAHNLISSMAEFA